MDSIYLDFKIKIIKIMCIINIVSTCINTKAVLEKGG